ncbi:MAG: GDP-mannose 4,6-dehydratase [Chloroflexota bacterium]|nr:GDP-mannose 4,6-dehydratase [Chloroflexota bacterium]
MRLLVTGCAGFIGAAVARTALGDGHEVVGVDNLNDAYAPALKQWRLDRLAPLPRFAFVRADVADRALGAALAPHGRFDTVVNLAARAGVRDSRRDPWSSVEANALGALNLLEFCREAGVPKFVQASTSSVYGGAARPFTEETPPDPRSPYAASKLAAEAYCAAYHHLYGIDASILRYFTVYGPAGRPDMAVFRFVHWIEEGRPVVLFGDGRQERDFTHVDDVARATLSALRPLGCEVVNVGGARPVSMLDLIALIERATGKAAVVERREAQAADAPATWADVSKARELLDWAPITPLEDGIAACVAWRREHRALAAAALSVSPPPARIEARFPLSRE